VVDSISNLFRDVDTGVNQELSERSRTLYVLARLLKEYAYTYDIVVVVTNHVRDMMDSESTSSVRAPRAQPYRSTMPPSHSHLLHLLLGSWADSRGLIRILGKRSSGPWSLSRQARGWPLRWAFCGPPV